MVPECYRTSPPINTLAQAFLNADWPKTMAELNKQATFQLQRRNLKPQTRAKWRRLKAIANLVNSQN